MINMEKDKLLKELLAEKLEELVSEFEHCFDGARLIEVQREIDACHTLIGRPVAIKKYYAN